MHLVFHGGKCCGIKTIYEMDDDPELVTGSLDALDGIQQQDILYNTTSTKDRFFSDAAPCEKRHERLDRYINFVKKWRPKHIIEVTLAEGPGYSQKKWFPVLEERGFKRVNSCLNSNSGNRVYVYHLNVGE